MFLSGEKYELAKKVNINLVNHQWLEAWYVYFLTSLVKNCGIMSCFFLLKRQMVFTAA
jgi:hypothetical protein